MKGIAEKINRFLHVHIKTYAQVEHKIHNRQQKFKAIKSKQAKNSTASSEAFPFRQLCYIVIQQLLTY